MVVVRGATRLATGFQRHLVFASKFAIQGVEVWEWDFDHQMIKFGSDVAISNYAYKFGVGN